jgi:hypothetical protein
MPSSDADLVARRGVGQAGVPLVRLENCPEWLQDRLDANSQPVQADSALVRSFFRAPSVAYITD